MQFQYGAERNNELIRQTSLKLRDVSYQIENANVDDALSYFERRTDTSAVREAYKDRYAVGIQKTEGEGGYETFTKGPEAELIDNGGYEIITVGLGPRINNARATMFTSKVQSWDWVTGEGAEQQSDEDVAKIIEEQRRLGGFDVQLPNADYIACGIESGPLYTGWFGGHLMYKAFSPSCLFAKFGDSIIDDGVERGVHYDQIEDAYCIVILLSTKRDSNNVSPHLSNYIAYFGRSEEYPVGRMVQYTSHRWDAIPDVDKDDTAVEYRLKSGEIANPLSYMARQKSSDGVHVPEYPVCIFHGGVSMTDDTLLPISTSLFESCLEIDVAVSRILKAGISSATGKDVLTNELGHDLPRSLEGAVLLHKGQTLSIMGQPVSNAQGAMEITKDTMRAIAEGYSVPGYKVIQEPGGNPESGVALIVRTQSLFDERDRRVKLNRREVDRLWGIERYTYEFATGQALGNTDTRQIWNAGRNLIPETETEKINRLNVALQNGAIDYPRYIRDVHDLPTDKDAMNFIDKMNDPERLAYQQPKASGALRTGLPLNLASTLQRPPNRQEGAAGQGPPVPNRPPT